MPRSVSKFVQSTADSIKNNVLKNLTEKQKQKLGATLRGDNGPEAQAAKLAELRDFGLSQTMYEANAEMAGLATFAGGLNAAFGVPENVTRERREEMQRISDNAKNGKKYMAELRSKNSMVELEYQYAVEHGYDLDQRSLEPGREPEEREEIGRDQPAQQPEAGAPARTWRQGGQARQQQNDGNGVVLGGNRIPPPEPWQPKSAPGDHEASRRESAIGSQRNRKRKEEEETKAEEKEETPELGNPARRTNGGQLGRSASTDPENSPRQDADAKKLKKHPSVPSPGTIGAKVKNAPGQGPKNPGPRRSL
ncbi:MAG: hypothetical protein H7A53_01220 [Akkermansiaceae bacterium]|nr:hypothetical protein [Akkermansiaceae bacterium]MCP5549506.1 hypothetical protein [Akkermansiaceae bacterium]